ncbi:MAG: hypothetical protein Ta2F_02510 [Termitinemataceae bacterium]|nr:MAG: hypothetical protein Ta2F_02510 [Termitinemataceae bacterium]
MIDPKLAGIIAAGTFLLSFLLGLIGRSTFTVSLLRGLIFAVAFFGIAAGVQYVFKKFLLKDADSDSEENDADDLLGKNVDVDVGDDFSIDLGPDDTDDIAFTDEQEELAAEGTDEAEQEAPPAETLTDDSYVEEFEDVDSFPDSEGKGLDQNTKNVYDDTGGVITFPQKKDDLDIGDFIPGLPGLDSSNSSYIKTSASSSDSKGSEYDMDNGMVEMSMGKYSGNKLDFEVDGKKAAGAIQTLLKKDDN